jgi:hypothetical protein
VSVYKQLKYRYVHDRFKVVLVAFGIDPFIVFDEFLDDFFQYKIIDQLFDNQRFIGDWIEMTNFVKILLDTRSTIGDAN